MPTTQVILAAIGYAVLTGLFNLIFSKKTQIEAWCAANPRLAAIGMFMRSIGFDPHNLWAFATLIITKKLPAIKIANSDVVRAEVRKIDAKARANEHVSIIPEGPLFVLIAFCALRLATACHSAPPCDESKLRAIDLDYETKVIAQCLPKYDVKEECPAFAGLQAEHKRQLAGACPQ